MTHMETALGYLERGGTGLTASLFVLLPTAVAHIQEYAATGTMVLQPDVDDEWLESNGLWPNDDDDRFPDEPVRREKIGRNEPCPCGSGKKYKKCCGQ